jgi:diguanylate cyclase (GGDEF)-like protein
MAALLACALLTGLQRRHGSEYPAGTGGMWELPAVVLAPPVFACTVPAAAAIACWRPRRLVCAVRAVAIGLADGAMSAAFHAVAPPQPPSAMRGGQWLLAVLAAGIIWQALSCAVSRVVPHGKRVPGGADDGRELLRGAVAELCAGVLVTCSAVLSPLCVLLAVPLATPLLRSAQHARLARDARTDARTGLLNAAAWQEAAAAEVTRAVRAWLPLAMVLLDIDHFKAVNDTHGHLAGDQVLRAVAGIIGSQLRGYDIAGRYGGDEIAILLPHTQPGQARRIAERLRMAVAAARLTASTADGTGTCLRVTVSAGVACLADCGPELQALIAAGDAALYDAKAAGRNRVRSWRGQPPSPAASARDETTRDGCTLVPAASRAADQQ